MRRFVLLLGAALVLAGCGEEPETAAFDATVRFRVRPSEGGGDAVGREATTALAVEKAGRTAVVDAWAEGAPKGTVYGRHRFPPGTTASAMAAYYHGLLRNAGWSDADVRFERDGALLRLVGVSRLEARADGVETAVEVERPASR